MVRNSLLRGLCQGAWAALWVVAFSAHAATGPAEPPGATPADTGTAVVVFAAASLTDVLEEVDAAFTAQSAIPVKASYAASSVLARQIEAGAPADVYLSADREWMDFLAQRGLIRADSRRDLLSNALVLIAPVDSKVHLKIAPGFDLAGALGTGRLATGDPDSVPVGKYARAALGKLGVWQQVADRLVRADNTRVALEYVARGESPLGIVYQTDAIVEKRVKVLGVFPENTHPPITYPVALTRAAHGSSARYLEFVSGDAARQIFERRGFVPLAVAQSPRTR
jgi:molybdate transport system substrate-binding protein